MLEGTGSLFLYVNICKQDAESEQISGDMDKHYAGIDTNYNEAQWESAVDDGDDINVWLERCLIEPDS